MNAVASASDMVCLALGAGFAGGTTPEALTAAFPATGYVAATSNAVLVYPRPVPGVPDVGDYLAYRLSHRFSCAVLLSDVRNDSLRLRLFDNGATVDEYSTAPYGADDDPQGGNAEALLTAFGGDFDTAEFLAPLLRAARFDDDYGYNSATERLAGVAELLDIPALVGSYDAIAQGQFPEGIAPTDLSHTESTSTTVAQFTLLRVPVGTSETETASYLLPEIVSLERGIEVDEWVSDFGSLASVRETVLKAFPVASAVTANWLVVPSGSDAVLHVDLGFRADTESVETVRVFAVTPSGVFGINAVRDLAVTLSSVAWDWKTRRVL